MQVGKWSSVDEKRQRNKVRWGTHCMFRKTNNLWYNFTPSLVEGQFVKHTTIFFLLIWIVVGCGRVITPTPQKSVTPEPTPVAVNTPTFTPRPTATPKIATPIASPTPTVTPTPIIYAVQSGDTLLKIAIQFDRPAEAIQEANGIVDPRFLQIGQTLIIPPPEQNADTPPTPTPTPPPLNVTSIYFQEAKDGSLWSLGQVFNPGDTPLTEVVVEAALFDAQGVLLAREAAFTQLDAIRPGESAPFAILFETPPGDYAQYQVAAVAGVPLSAQTRYYFDLETFDVRGSERGENVYRVRGQLRNFGSSDVESIRLVVIAFDEEEQVLAQRQANLAVTLLKAGAATPFELDLIIPNGTVDHYQVLGQGLAIQ